MEPDSSGKKDFIAFLRSHPTATIATVKQDGTPHAVSIYFYVDDDLHFYFITKDNTSKFSAIANNANIALVVTDQAVMQTAQLEGQAKAVHYPQEHAETVKQFTENLEKNGIDWMQAPFNHLAGGSYVMLEIVPTWIRWSDFKDWSHTLKFEQRFTS